MRQLALKLLRDGRGAAVSMAVSLLVATASVPGWHLILSLYALCLLLEKHVESTETEKKIGSLTSWLGELVRRHGRLDDALRSLADGEDSHELVSRQKAQVLLAILESPDDKLWELLERDVAATEILDSVEKYLSNLPADGIRELLATVETASPAKRGHRPLEWFSDAVLGLQNSSSQTVALATVISSTEAVTCASALADVIGEDYPASWSRRDVTAFQVFDRYRRPFRMSVVPAAGLARDEGSRPNGLVLLRRRGSFSFFQSPPAIHIDPAYGHFNQQAEMVPVDSHGNPGARLAFELDELGPHETIVGACRVRSASTRLVGGPVWGCGAGGIIGIVEGVRDSVGEPADIAQISVRTFDELESLALKSTIRTISDHIPSQAIGRRPMLLGTIDRVPWLRRMIRHTPPDRRPIAMMLEKQLRDLELDLEDQTGSPRDQRYVTMSAMPEEATPGLSRDRILGGRVLELVGGTLDRFGVRDHSRTRVSAVRTRRVRNIARKMRLSKRPMLLLGDPGSGKSLTVRVALMRLIRRELRKQYPSVCLFVRLRDLSRISSTTSPATSVLRYLENTLPPSFRPMLEGLHATRRVIVVFDGLDEMSRRAYGEFTAALAAYAMVTKWTDQGETISVSGEPPAVVTLLTCRSADIHPSLKSAGVTTLTLEEFNEDQIRDFLVRYGVSSVTIEGEKFATPDELAHHLATEWDTLDSRNPFALWMLVPYLLDNARWPKHRVELMSSSLRTKVDVRRSKGERQRIYGRAGAHTVNPALSESEFQDCCRAWAELALEIMIANEGGACQIKFARCVCLKHCHSIDAFAIGIECGLFVYQTDHLITFEHARWQEYLAAIALQDRSDFSQIGDPLRLFRSPRWREVMINLLLGAPEHPLSGAFIEEVLGRTAEIWESRSETEPVPVDLLEEAELADYVDYLSHLAKASSQTTVHRMNPELGQIVREAIPSLAQHGSPPTQYRMLDAARRVDPLIAATVAETVENTSSVDWVRSEAISTKYRAMTRVSPTATGYDGASSTESDSARIRGRLAQTFAENRFGPRIKEFWKGSKGNRALRRQVVFATSLYLLPFLLGLLAILSVLGPAASGLRWRAELMSTEPMVLFYSKFSIRSALPSPIASLAQPADSGPGGPAQFVSHANWLVEAAGMVGHPITAVVACALAIALALRSGSAGGPSRATVFAVGPICVLAVILLFRATVAGAHTAESLLFGAITSIWILLAVYSVTGLTFLATEIAAIIWLAHPSWGLDTVDKLVAHLKDRGEDDQTVPWLVMPLGWFVFPGLLGMVGLGISAAVRSFDRWLGAMLEPYQPQLEWFWEFMLSLDYKTAGIEILAGAREWQVLILLTPFIVLAAVVAARRLRKAVPAANATRLVRRAVWAFRAAARRSGPGNDGERPASGKHPIRLVARTRRLAAACSRLLKDAVKFTFHAVLVFIGAFVILSLAILPHLTVSSAAYGFVAHGAIATLQLWVGFVAVAVGVHLRNRGSALLRNVFVRGPLTSLVTAPLIFGVAYITTSPQIDLSAAPTRVVSGAWDVLGPLFEWINGPGWLHGAIAVWTLGGSVITAAILAHAIGGRLWSRFWRVLLRGILVLSVGVSVLVVIATAVAWAQALAEENLLAFVLVRFLGTLAGCVVAFGFGAATLKRLREHRYLRRVLVTDTMSCESWVRHVNIGSPRQRVLLLERGFERINAQRTERINVLQRVRSACERDHRARHVYWKLVRRVLEEHRLDEPG